MRGSGAAGSSEETSEATGVSKETGSSGAAGPDRRPFFPSLLGPQDAAELPQLTGMSADWEELTRGYDVVAQLAAIVNGLLPRPS